MASGWTKQISNISFNIHFGYDFVSAFLRIAHRIESHQTTAHRIRWNNRRGKEKGRERNYQNFYLWFFLFSFFYFPISSHRVRFSWMNWIAFSLSPRVSHSNSELFLSFFHFLGFRCVLFKIHSVDSITLTLRLRLLWEWPGRMRKMFWWFFIFCCCCSFRPFGCLISFSTHSMDK